MQNYKILNNKIVVTNPDEFNSEHILECGQVFRYKKFDNYFEVYSKNKKAKIFSYADKVEIETNDVEYFVNYFDLATNYSNIKQKLAQYGVLKPMLEFAYGIRILRQDAFEMIVDFLISANNNIKRIQLIIEKICQKFGSFVEAENFYAFPTREQLLKASVEDFKSLGLGYRAQYLYNLIRQLENFDYDFITNNSSEKCLPILLKLSGVGPKIADCILLFGFHKADVFPVDTWIIKVYNDYFAKNFEQKNENLELQNQEIRIKNDKNNGKNNPKNNKNVKEIRKNLLNIFGNLSGYAQQYLFYYQRSGLN